MYYHSIWYRHTLYSRLQRVMIPDAVIMQFVLLKMGMLMLGNMSRIIMEHTYCYRIKELCIKLVIDTSFFYDAWSEIDQKQYVRLRHVSASLHHHQ